MSFHNSRPNIPTGNYLWARQTDPYGRVRPSKQPANIQPPPSQSNSSGASKKP